MPKCQIILCRQRQKHRRGTCGDGQQPVTVLCSERLRKDATSRLAEEMHLLQPELVKGVDYFTHDGVYAVVV